MWTGNRENILSLDAAILGAILAWEKLDIKNEFYVWMIIEQWILNDITGRIQHLPELLKKCLRFGRLPDATTRETILGGRLVNALSESDQRNLAAFVSGVLSKEQLELTIRDGFNLPYSKAVFYFRPRQTKQYLLCAGGWIEGQTTDSIELFDYQTNLWLSTPFKLPSRISYFGLELLGDCLYLFGGSNGREIFKALSVLDLSGKKMPVWTGKCSMIERRCYVTSAVLDGVLYALGGFNQTRRLRRCERYNRHLDSWEEIAEFNLARSDAAAAPYEGKLYVAGGINDSAIESTVEVFYPESNIWRLVKQMSSPRTSFALVCYGNRLWAIAGNDGARRVATVESYDTQADTWQEEASLGAAQVIGARARGRSTFRAVNFNGELYVVGGYNSESS